MTVRELIDYLEDFDSQSIVKIAYQPRWPMAEKVYGVTEFNGVVYLGGDNQNEYVPAGAALDLGWSGNF